MAENKSKVQVEFLIHPGETLKEILEDRGITVRELAKQAGASEHHIHRVINCQKSISAAFARQLEQALDVEACFWLNLQANYDKERLSK